MPKPSRKTKMRFEPEITTPWRITAHDCPYHQLPLYSQTDTRTGKTHTLRCRLCVNGPRIHPPDPTQETHHD